MGQRGRHRRHRPAALTVPAELLLAAAVAALMLCGCVDAIARVPLCKARSCRMLAEVLKRLPLQGGAEWQRKGRRCCQRVHAYVQRPDLIAVACW